MEVNKISTLQQGGRIDQKVLKDIEKNTHHFSLILNRCQKRIKRFKLWW